MTAATEPQTEGAITAPGLIRSLTLRDLVLFHIVAVVSLRWVATAGAAGPSSITLWILAALFFFIPQGLAVSELAARYPDAGGIYAWTKRAYGEGHGFLCGWCYWVNNVLYPPNILMATAVIATYAIGKGDSGLADSWSYVLPTTLGMLWFAVALNIVGVSTGKWLQNVGAFGSLLPGTVLAGLGLYALAHGPSATPMGARDLVPDLGNFSEINLWASIAFAFAGLELAPVMAGETRDPARSLPRSILLAAPFILALYIIGTVALLILVPSKDVNIVSGFLQGISVGAGKLGVGPWLAVVCAAMFVIGNLGGIGAWLSGPARVALMIGLDRYFPPAFGKIHPRWRTPYMAILFQALFAMAVLFVSVLGKGTTVEKAYLIVLDTMLLVYFIPYIYMFLAYLKFTRLHPTPTASRPKALLVGGSGLLLTVLAMVVAMVPPSDTPSVALFELKVGGGALFFVLLGGFLYWRATRGMRAAA
ncbi:MAG TPA: APC family permease [Gemmatimonadales bacterium]|nr:APC family permease [Gemmatimonadales bacterium]